MTGQKRCALLKQIRKEIAEGNGIVYLTAACNIENDCTGMCEKCQAEIQYLDDELIRKVERGEKITLSGLNLNSIVDDLGGECYGMHECNGQSLKNKVLEMKIEELNFAIRTCSCLKSAGIKTIEDIVNMTEEELMTVKNLGRKSFEEILKKLSVLGLTLKQELLACEERKRPLNMHVIVYEFNYDEREGMRVLEMDSEEMAQKEFKRIGVFEKRIAKEKGYEIFADTETCFDAGNPNNYHDDHVKFLVKKTRKSRF